MTSHFFFLLAGGVLFEAVACNFGFAGTQPIRRNNSQFIEQFEFLLIDFLLALLVGGVAGAVWFPRELVGLIMKFGYSEANYSSHWYGVFHIAVCLFLDNRGSTLSLEQMQSVRVSRLVQMYSLIDVWPRSTFIRTLTVEIACDTILWQTFEERKLNYSILTRIKLYDILQSQCKIIKHYTLSIPVKSWKWPSCTARIYRRTSPFLINSNILLWIICLPEQLHPSSGFSILRAAAIDFRSGWPAFRDPSFHRTLTFKLCRFFYRKSLTDWAGRSVNLKG